jgi:hypothetical protein
LDRVKFGNPDGALQAMQLAEEKIKYQKTKKLMIFWTKNNRKSQNTIEIIIFFNPITMTTSSEMKRNTTTFQLIL